ncbi:hypothetical protein H8959_004829, partial [Pygathrix nigripes]
MIFDTPHSDLFFISKYRDDSLECVFVFWVTNSNLESSRMYDILGPQQGRGCGSSGGGPGNSITACKKVLRSNSLLESTDYWLQNQRMPCQIGFIEDKSENCASVCFVNLDVNKDECSTEHLQQ